MKTSEQIVGKAFQESPLCLRNNEENDLDAIKEDSEFSSTSGMTSIEDGAKKSQSSLSDDSNKSSSLKNSYGPKKAPAQENPGFVKQKCFLEKNLQADKNIDLR